MPVRALTLGLSFPHDWRFVLSTAPAAGDPLDALVPHNITTSPGMVLRCRPVGIVDVLRTENRKSIRNDRLIVVPVGINTFPGADDVRRLPASLRHEAEEFFVAAVAGTRRKLKFLGWRGPRSAMARFAKLRRRSGWPGGNGLRLDMPVLARHPW